MGIHFQGRITVFETTLSSIDIYRDACFAQISKAGICTFLCTSPVITSTWIGQSVLLCSAEHDPDI